MAVLSKRWADTGTAADGDGGGKLRRKSVHGISLWVVGGCWAMKKHRLPLRRVHILLSFMFRHKPVKLLSIERKSLSQ
jgi:hypothetical protein